MMRGHPQRRDFGPDWVNVYRGLVRLFRKVLDPIGYQP